MNYQKKKIAEAPRHVPFSTAVQVIFGGLSNRIGWPIFGFGMIFFWFFSFRSELTHLPLYFGKTVTVPGKVNQVRETGTVVNEQSIEEYYFSFWTKEGEKLEGSSFGTDYQYHVGSKVSVEYLKSNPEYARIEGCRTAENGIAIGLLPLVIPLIGLVMVTIALNGGIRSYWLLKKGVAGYGKLTRKKATGREINDQVIYKMFFKFKAIDGNEYMAVTHTHETDALEDEEKEVLLYNPQKPREGILFDNLPGSPQLNELGEIIPATDASVTTSLLIPVISLLGNFFYLFYHLHQGL
ncbi:hypothetical protein R9C00_23455 [Flammeovirgaceae bacterium SG7u.111]|nr:hypothetical protein [Flammeovirgaceae bacterium SG7u.132]WPO34662.1 hypothetical protein R9C00_23455 [Flammeovirgaceae bacterium SG7u.111]